VLVARTKSIKHQSRSELGYCLITAKMNQKT
jgi:hypothetical protein